MSRIRPARSSACRGFGGNTVNAVDSAEQNEFRAGLEENYEALTGKATILHEVRPSPGLVVSSLSRASPD